MVNSKSKKDETIKEGTEGLKNAKEGFRIPKTCTLGSKEIFELSLRYGIYLRIKGNKQEEVKLPEFIEPKDVTSEELSEIIDELEKKVKDTKKTSHLDVKSLIQSISNNLNKTTLPIQEYEEKYLRELTYINMYIHKYITFNKNIGDELEKIDSSIINKISKSTALNFNSGFIIEFIEVLYNKFGEGMNIKVFSDLIGEIADSNNNTMLLEFIKEICDKSTTITMEGLLNIVRICKKIIFKPYEKIDKTKYKTDEVTTKLISELEQQNDERNIEFNMVTDIINSIDYGDGDIQELIDYLQNIEKLSSENLNEYWLNSTLEQFVAKNENESAFKIPNERLNLYIKEQEKNKETKQRDKMKKIKKPNKLEQELGSKMYKMAKRVAIIVGAAAGIFLASKVLSHREAKIENDIQTEEQEIENGTFTGELSNVKLLGAPGAPAVGFLYQGTPVSVEKNGDQYEVSYESDGIKITFVFDEKDLDNDPEWKKEIYRIMGQNINTNYLDKQNEEIEAKIKATREELEKSISDNSISGNSVSGNSVTKD